MILWNKNPFLENGAMSGSHVTFIQITIPLVSIFTSRKNIIIDSILFYRLTQTVHSSPGAVFLRCGTEEQMIQLQFPTSGRVALHLCKYIIRSPEEDHFQIIHIHFI